ncbi:LysR family transcriptional regulator [Marinomonas algicola]|uniref:LysR family transcriptional regulator n=1 Tax=Marinomonas algicola TaxID=2773454 RepID=UPI0019D4F9D0|nr:LysR family transcriptional regulator [Marinomonas algicola]
MLDKLKSMQIFVHVVQSESFTKAAVDFAISPTMIGKHIKSLEQQLGVRLLHRTTRRHSLSDAGQLYYLECVRILENISEAENNIQTFAERPTGTVRINCPVTFGNIILAPIVTDFLNLNEGINIDLILDNNLIDPLHDHFDLIIRIGELADSELIARSIGEYEMVFCASPDYLEKNTVPDTLESLLNHSCLGFSYGDIQAHRALGIDTLAFNKQHVRLASNSGQVLKTAAIKHTGILLQPRMLVKDALEKGVLVEILQKYTPAPMGVNLLYKTKQLPLKTRMVIEFLLAKIKR